MSTAIPIQAPSAGALAQAAHLLQAGQLVAFPTETVYGLGADATNDAAVARIFAVKQRPRFNPLIVHVTSIDQAERDARIDARTRKLAEAFWPGPLTLVLARRRESRLSLLVSAGLDTVAVRAPDHEVARALITGAGGPIAAPSANRFGCVSPTTALHVWEGLGRDVPLILDGGPCRLGIESTVLDVTGPLPRLLRPGAISDDAIAAVIGEAVAPAPGAGEPGQPLRGPGMLRRHYAPGRPVRLQARHARPGEVLIGFGPDAPLECINLSRSGSLDEAAATLFAVLRALDRPEVAAIAVMPIPEHGLGRAINDRLQRAAADEDEADHDRGPAAPCVLPEFSDEPA